MGNQTAKTFVFDSIKPSLSDAKITSQTTPDWEKNGQKWYKNSRLDIQITANDTAPNGSIVSGIQCVEYTLEENPSEDDWILLVNKSSDNWDATVLIPSTGEYTVKFRAIDVAQNIYKTGDIPTAQDSISFSVDMDRPSAPTSTISSTVLTNGVNDIVIPLDNITDKGSGVKALVLKSIGTDTFNTAIKVNPNEQEDVTITKEQIALTTGGAVVFELSDNVGNITETKLFTVRKDIVNPSITIISPVENERDDVNGTIALELDIQDNNVIESVILEKKDDATWKKSDTNSSDGWNFFIDTTDGTFTDGKQDFVIRVKDIAGNTQTQEFSLTINAAADIPVITLTNVDVTSMSVSESAKLKEGVVRGIVKDDDGAVNLSISTDNGVNYTDVPVNSDGTWIFPQSGELPNGENTLTFKITDANNTIFSNSKITDTELTIVTVAVDTEPPSIDKIEISFDGSNWSTLQDNMLLGGVTKKNFRIRIKARDTNEVKSFSIEKNGVLIDKTLFGDFEITGADGKEKTATMKNSLPATIFDDDGYQRITMNVYDAVGGVCSESKQIIVDNNVPVITDITSHEYNAKVTGTVELQATISGGNPGATIESVYYAIPERNGSTWVQPEEMSSFWKTVSVATVGFTIKFDGENEPTLTSFTETNGIKNDTGDLWYVPVVFKLTDSLGQVHITDVPSGKDDIESTGEDHFKFIVDPNGDKPSVAVSYPLQAGSEPTVLGGTIGIFGSAKDNEAIDAVYMQIDIDADGDYDDDKTTLQSDYTVTDINPTPRPEGSDPDAWWGIKVTGKNSWNFKINESDEFNGKTIKYRVRSVDLDGAVSEWSNPIAIKVDADVPTIGESQQLTLVQYERGNSGAIAKQQKYVDDMWISGLWYLTGSIEDTNGIASIDIEGDISVDETSSFFTVASFDAGENASRGYTMNIPLGTDSSNISFSISATKQTESNPPTTQRMISVNRDNTAPSATDVLKSRDLPIDNSNIVQQSDARYTFGSEITESGGGLSHIAFWFERNVVGDDSDRIYNPMEERTNDANKTTLQRGTIVSGDVGMIDNLPRLHLEDVTRDSESTIRHDSIINNKNVRIGGLITIAGVDHRIDDVDYGTGTVSFSPSVATSYTSADIAYVMVVDNQGVIETMRDNGTISNDDGDGMLEFIEKSGNDYTWTASIDSRNIPDGPIEIHFVAYDKSGNVSVGKTAVSTVSNNAPKISNIFLGTDLNGNNRIDEFEKQKISKLDGSDNAVSNATFDASSFTAKGKTTVTPEIVGGNGDIYFSVGNTKPATSVEKLPTTDDCNCLGDCECDDIGAITVILPDDTIVDNIAGEPAVFNYILWDSTEEAEVGINSQNATLSITMHVDVVDDISPITTINPFYWTSETENSLYENSRANGHIELPDHLPDTFTEGGSGVNDCDPKVSGKITFRGTVSDNKNLSEIWLKIDDFIFANTLTGGTAPMDNMVKIGEFDSDTGSWTTSSSTMDTNKYVFSIVENNLSQTGHEVTWQLDWDSSGITNMAGVDKSLFVASKDKAGKISNSIQCQIDIVPYICTVSTEIGRKKSTNARTARGNYVVKNDETGVVLEGFNLGSATNVTVPDSSASYEITVKGVTSLNNINNNTADYNKIIGIENNDTLTDDVYFDVWEYDTVAYARDAAITYPEMDISPKDGSIGFAFVDNYYFHMPGSDKDGNNFVSQRPFEMGVGPYFESALAFDKHGNPYGISANQDQGETEGSYVCFYFDRVERKYFWKNRENRDTGTYKRNILPTGTKAETITVKRAYSPSIAVTNTGSDRNTTATNVYTAYFDIITKELRYSYGTVADGADVGGQLDYNASNTCCADVPSKYSVITTLDDGIDYVSLDAKTLASGDMVVITWYDKVSGTLQLAYNSGNALKTDDSTWNYKTIDSSNSGLYNSVKIDEAGGVHIAYHTTSGLDLKYGYLSSVTAEPEIVTVDSFGATGKNIRLDVTKDLSGNFVPYISYYEGGIAKIAHRENFNELLDGADKTTGKYTGNWEVSCIHSSSTVRDDTISVGVWTDNSGTHAAIPTKNNQDNNIADGFYGDGTTQSIIGGNGTMNPVISYVNSAGNLEMAQLK